MKKFKIFLLLSILLCFGFMLNSEVHAQSNGPKAFEIGDVLPQGLVKITGQFYSDGEIFIYLSSDYTNLFMSKSEDDDDFAFGNSFDSFLVEDNTDYSSGSINAIFDFSSLSESERTFNSGYYDGGNKVYWEEYIAGYSITFEENGGTEQTDLSDVTALPDPLPIPTKAHHVFTGWYYDNLFTQKANAGDELTANVILYAKWEQLATNAKIFEVGDILPAGNIKISWDFTDKGVIDGGVFVISSDGDLFIEIREFVELSRYVEIIINDDNIYAATEPGGTVITLTEPVTITDVSGTHDYNVYIGDALMWEVMPLYDGERLEIEEGTILPAAKIGINLVYNNTGGPKNGTVVYTFSEPLYEFGQIIFIAQEDNLGALSTSAEIVVQVNPAPRGWNIYVIDDSLANQSFGSTRGFLSVGILLDFTWATEEERTITDISIVEGDLELDIIFTRILTTEEIAYQEGYSNGYITAREIFGWKDGDNWYNGVDAWNLGEKYARELYGYYDSSTDEWLSVSEYVARYGTDKPGQSDFYGNFDKYFIPAMIIVFGGAIVLTILKVFKGRE